MNEKDDRRTAYLGYIPANASTSSETWFSGTGNGQVATMNRNLQWIPEYSVGVPVLDEQHKHLLELCSEAKQLIQAPNAQAREQLHGILHELSTYVEKHFETEEAHLSEIDYAEIDAHIAAHQAYRARLTRLLLDATIGTLDPSDLINHLGKWWIGHILGEDKGYANAADGLLVAVSAGNNQGTDQ